MKNKITPWDILNYSLQNIFFKGIEVDIAGVQKSEETIANFQWFLRRPSALNVFGRSDHCHQWFYDGFLMLLPSLSMVFDGSGPLVKRCDGFDGSSWSNHPRLGHQCQLLTEQVPAHFLSRECWCGPRKFPVKSVISKKAAIRNVIYFLATSKGRKKVFQSVISKDTIWDVIDLSKSQKEERNHLKAGDPKSSDLIW